MLKLKLKVSLPDSNFLSQDCFMATLPGESGDISILYGHTPIISVLSPGLLWVYPKSLEDVPQKYFVKGGIAYVLPEICCLALEDVFSFERFSLKDLQKKIRKKEDNYHKLPEKDKNQEEFLFNQAMYQKWIFLKQKYEA